MLYGWASLLGDGSNAYYLKPFKGSKVCILYYFQHIQFSLICKFHYTENDKIVEIVLITIS